MAWHCWLSGFLPPFLWIASDAIALLCIWMSIDSMDEAIEKFYDASPYGKLDIMCLSAG